MKTEQEIRKELHNSEYLYRLNHDTRKYCKNYWRAGYIQALKVVLGIDESEILKEIREITDFDNLRKILDEIEE